MRNVLLQEIHWQSIEQVSTTLKRIPDLKTVSAFVASLGKANRRKVIFSITEVVTFCQTAITPPWKLTAFIFLKKHALPQTQEYTNSKNGFKPTPMKTFLSEVLQCQVCTLLKSLSVSKSDNPWPFLSNYFIKSRVWEEKRGSFWGSEGMELLAG